MDLGEYDGDGMGVSMIIRKTQEGEATAVMCEHLSLSTPAQLFIETEGTHERAIA